MGIKISISLKEDGILGEEGSNLKSMVKIGVLQDNLEIGTLYWLVQYCIQAIEALGFYRESIIDTMQTIVAEELPKLKLQKIKDNNNDGKI